MPEVVDVAVRLVVIDADTDAGEDVLVIFAV